MLSHTDFLEATRRFKGMKTKPHARTRYHALLLFAKGYSYHQTAAILFVNPEEVPRWVARYEEEGPDGLQNHPHRGGGTGNAGSQKSS